MNPENKIPGSYWSKVPGKSNFSRGENTAFPVLTPCSQLPPESFLCSQSFGEMYHIKEKKAMAPESPVPVVVCAGSIVFCSPWSNFQLQVKLDQSGFPKSARPPRMVLISQRWQCWHRWSLQNPSKEVAIPQQAVHLQGSQCCWCQGLLLPCLNFLPCILMLEELCCCRDAVWAVMLNGKPCEAQIRWGTDVAVVGGRGCCSWK